MADSLDTKWKTAVLTFDYAFQPIVNIYSGVCYGYEALLRNVREAGFSSIGEVFDFAYSGNILHQVDLALRRKAIEKFCRIKKRNGEKLFFNLDNRLLDSVDYQHGSTRRLLDDHGVDRDIICFEISEKHEPRQTQKMLEVLASYRDQGFKIAVDDCGAGFSGMKMLYYSDPEFIKIDRFFIQDIADDPKKRLFVASLVNIAHLTGSLVVAEGVETEKEYFSCRDIGCDLVQGYLVQAPQSDVRKLKWRYRHISRLSSRRQSDRGAQDQALIKTEIQHVDPLQSDCDLIQVLSLFKKEKARSFFPVVNGAKEPVGVLRERDLKKYTHNRYGHDLLQNPTYGRNIHRFIQKYPVADIHTPIEKILEIYSQDTTLEGIIIADQMKYLGFLSAQSLIKVLNEKNLAFARDQNPLTRLPGNTMIHQYISKILRDTDSNYSLVYFDFDNFKPYNDTYGFRQGDRVILMFSELLTSRNSFSDRFIGHIGGDDFFMGIRGSAFPAVKAQMKHLAETFKTDVESFYDPDTIRRGYIMARERDGRECRFNLLAVSVVILHLPVRRRPVFSMDEIGNLLAILKKQAKQSVDRFCEGWIGEAEGTQRRVACHFENLENRREGGAFLEKIQKGVSAPAAHRHRTTAGGGGEIFIEI